MGRNSWDLGILGDFGGFWGIFREKNVVNRKNSWFGAEKDLKAVGFTPNFVFQVSQEILELLNTTTAKEQSIVEKFRSRGRAQVQEFCDHGTKEECVKATGADRPCRKLHFR